MTGGRLVLVGGGNMGGALLDGWLANGVSGDRIAVIDPGLSDERRARWEKAGVALHGSADELNAPADTLLIAVKPQAMAAVLPAVASLVGSNTLGVSVAAGVTLATLRNGLNDAPCLRAMPNTPSQVGRGVTVCCATDDVSDDRRATVADLMAAVGTVEWVEDEADMDAVTAVSGSGPAYVFHLAEALAEAGERAGLRPDLAARLALHTVAGAGELMRLSDLAPGALREAVTSPNGTTQAALEVLMPELTALMERAVAAAAARSKELS